MVSVMVLVSVMVWVSTMVLTSVMVWVTVMVSVIVLVWTSVLVTVWVSQYPLLYGRLPIEMWRAAEHQDGKGGWERNIT